MSDLNDFFAKKDRKKKKAGARSSAGVVQRKEQEPETEPSIAEPSPKQQDDGWIEIEDPKGAKVNTGGRTVVEFKRCAAFIHSLTSPSKTPRVNCNAIR